MTNDARATELYLDFSETGAPPPHTLHVGVVGKQATTEPALPFMESRLMYKGRVGLEVTVDQASKAAKQATICALGMLREELNGSLNGIKHVIALRAYIATGTEFKDHDRILDKASALLADLFGPAGTHVRTAVGVASLPKGAPVAIELTVALK